MTRLSSIFATGMVASQHTNYLLCMVFLEGLAAVGGDAKRSRIRQRLLGQPSVAEFKARWNLPIYFQLRSVSARFFRGCVFVRDPSGVFMPEYIGRVSRFDEHLPPPPPPVRSYLRQILCAAALGLPAAEPLRCPDFGPGSLFCEMFFANHAT